ncbi:hypothetical protein HOY80DRAFT_1076102, partial [Tuber brumale]
LTLNDKSSLHLNTAFSPSVSVDCQRNEKSATMARAWEDGYSVLNTSAPSLPNGTNRSASRIPAWSKVIRQMVTPNKNPTRRSASRLPREPTGDIPGIAQHVYRTQVQPVAKQKPRPKVEKERETWGREERRGERFLGHPVHDWPEQPAMEQGRRGGIKWASVGERSGGTGGRGWRPIWEEGEREEEENGKGKEGKGVGTAIRNGP